MINFIFIQTFKFQTEENLKKEIMLYQELISKNIRITLPDYLKIVNDSSIKNNYVLFEIKKPNYFYIKEDFIKNQIKDKMLLLLYWDIIIIFSVAILYYLTIYRTLDREKQYLKTVEAVFLVFSHKLRNFLATTKINIELLNKGKKDALTRLVNINKMLETDLNNISKITEKLSINSYSKENVDIVKLIENIIEDFDLKNSFYIKKYGKKIYATCTKDEVYNALYLIFDNTKNYGLNRITIKSGLYKNLKYLLIKNNINNSNTSKDVHKGLGVGLNIAEKLLSKNRFKLKWRSTTKDFCIKISF
ncbi:MAG: hypothetical protein PWQ25_1538 [Deferribacteres bacterium]|jgi:signal transduction histidine kinase|nr:hypothetical protein [Deferribacteraceae bacterium]MDK2792675.1 hypothetical protein [Deferribacteres bacterium]